MKAFIWKCSALVIFLFIGVLLGMQLVTNEMTNMQGVQKKVDVVQPAPVAKPTIHQLVEKKQEMEDIKSFDLFSKTGDTLTNVIQYSFQATVDSILEGVKNMLSQSSS